MTAQTQLGRLGYLDWSDWLYGLISGFISGGAAAVVSGVVVSFKDPDHFNPITEGKNFFELVLTVFLVSGTLAAMNYLHNKPLPAKVVETTTKLPADEQGAKVTIKETHLEPNPALLPPPPKD